MGATERVAPHPRADLLGEAGKAPARFAETVGRIVIDGAVVTRDAYARAHAEARPVWDLRDQRGQVSAAIKEAAAEMRGVVAQCERMMEAA